MNVGIIGCHGMGAHHALMATNCALNVAVCADVNKDIADELAREYASESTTDCDAMIRREDLDIICVTTPTPLHVEYVVKAAEAGKHVFCEKPLARTVKDCERAIEAAEKAGVKLFVGHVVRYFHEYEAIREHALSGAIGKPGYVKMYRGGICPVGVGNWFRDWNASGGVTFDTAIHDFDWLRYVFGDVERVFCQNMNRQEPAPMDYSMTTLRLKSGLLAQVVGTWAHPEGFRCKVEVAGDGGLLTYDSDEMPVSMQRRTLPGEAPGMIIPGSPVAKSPYQREWEDFIAWIEGRGEPKMTPDDAVRAVEIADAALKSAESKKPVKLG